MSDNNTRLSTEVLDSYTNAVKGMGVQGVDPSLDGRYTRSKILEYNFEELTALYEKSWVARSFIDTIPNDMTREWRKITDSDMSLEDIEEFKAIEKFYDIPALFNEAQKQADLQGNAYIVMDIENTGEPMDPLNLADVKEGASLELALVDRSRMVGITPEFVGISGTPEYSHYAIARTGVTIHKSRVLKFYGNKRTGYAKQVSQYYDGSRLNPVYKSILNIGAAECALTTFITEASTDIWKVRDLFNDMASEERDLTATYVMNANRNKSITNAMVIDAEDEITQHVKDGGNVKEIYEAMISSVVAASGIPTTKFLGESASGFNATGRGDERNYYDMVKQTQVNKFNPLLDVLDEVLLLILGIDKERINFEWKPLFQLDAKELAEVYKANTEVIHAILDRGMINESIALDELIDKGILTNVPLEWREQLASITEKVNEGG